MKAMILGAGKGTRVRPLTYTVPKPMIPLVRKPVMESIIEHLASYGVDQIVINTSYLAPQIEDYFRDGERLGIDIAYSFEGRLVDGALVGEAVGSAGGMRRVQDHSGFFDSTFIVLCGDALIDLDISAAVAFHKSRGSIATLVMKEVPRDEVFRYGVVQTDNDGRILRFQEKPKVEDAVSTSVNTGIYIFEPEIFNFIPSGQEYDIGGDLFPRLAEAKQPFYGVTLPFQWVDIGSVPDFWEATRLILQGKVNRYRLPGHEVKPGIWTGINVSIDWDAVEISGPVYIGSSSSIGAGAKITGPTVIGPGSVIAPGAEVHECIIGDYTRVDGIARLEKLIVFGGRCIEPDGRSVDIAEVGIDYLTSDARATVELTEWQRLLIDTAKDLAL